MKREDNPENFTAIFLLDESGRRVVGATVEVIPDGPDAYTMVINKPWTGDKCRQMDETCPPGLQWLRSCSGRAEMLVSPVMVIPAGVLFRLLEQAEAQLRRALGNKPFIAVKPSGVKS